MPRISEARIGIIGAGRLGTALGKLFSKNGNDLVGISARSVASRERASRVVPQGPIAKPIDVARGSDVLFLTVADDAIEDVVEEISAADAVHAGQWLMHLSGRCGLSVLDKATARSAVPFALHPAMTFAGTDEDYLRFERLPFGVTAPEAHRADAQQVVRDLGGVPVWVPESDRILYHAALCFGANNLITLVAAAIEALDASGIDGAAKLIEPLVTASLKNALNLGDHALTGPVRRGDTGTIQAHIEAFNDSVPHLTEAYREFGRFTAQRAMRYRLNDEDALRRSVVALE